MQLTLKFLVFFLALSCSRSPSQKVHSLLDEIVENKILIVGTTGDYPPFSLQKSDDDLYTGIDIELAKNLAKTLGAQIQFYKTTWKDLLDDLKKNKFHIAMSGISKNSIRQQVGLFSISYIPNGKASIARCDETNNFNTLARIDRKGVRIIVNPGGTNQKFVQEMIKNANIITYLDNKTIFQEILSKRADVMITDSVEVSYQSKLHYGKLCPSSKNTFTHGNMGILMPRDLILKEYIDTWLEQIEMNGDMKKITSQFLL